MPLSEYEQRVLEQMERQLTSDDPRLANTLTQRGRRPVGRVLIASVGAALGLLLLVLGAAGDGLVWLGVVGFVVMFAAVAFAFSDPRRSGPQGVVRNDGTVSKGPSAKGSTRPAKKPAGQRGFMARFEERWERRRGESGR
ncbi:DUF3040 domain-containing protein [Cellulomonas soli]|nr:DUF3040 domain-containing protein [Cellulomonas soli]NYI60973.1 hypothetical protein [Cellulomonas soli]